MALLALEKNARYLRGLVDGKHDDGARVMDEIAAYLDPAWFDEVIGGHPENRAAIYSARGDEAGFGSPRSATFASRRNLGHAITIKHGACGEPLLADFLTQLLRELFHFLQVRRQVFCE